MKILSFICETLMNSFIQSVLFLSLGISGFYIFYLNIDIPIFFGYVALTFSGVALIIILYNRFSSIGYIQKSISNYIFLDNPFGSKTTTDKKVFNFQEFQIVYWRRAVGDDLTIYHKNKEVMNYTVNSLSYALASGVDTLDVKDPELVKQLAILFRELRVNRDFSLV